MSSITVLMAAPSLAAPSLASSIVKMAYIASKLRKEA